jgi:ribonuclease HI
MHALKRETEKCRWETAETYAPLVTIYADASCLRNPDPNASAGCGAVIIDRNRMEIKLVAKYLGPVTNQQAEVLACVKALEELRRPCRVEVFSDSMYVIDTMTGLNRMKTNRPFWGRLVEASLGHHITWRGVKVHHAATFHEAADRLACAASTAKSDLLSDDLDILAGHLSKENNQLNIRSFEIELDKIVSRYEVFDDSEYQVPKLDGVTSFPSAFSV